MGLLLMVGCASSEPDQEAEQVSSEASSSDAGTAGSSEEAPWVVFSSGRSGNGDLYAVRPDSADGEPEIRKVAGTEAPEGTVRYDAYQGRLVYQRHHDADGDQPAFAMLVSDGQDLFVDPNGDAAPVWSPTTGQIAYVARQDDNEDLFIAEADGSSPRALTQDAEVDRYPAWSPDGATLVFARRLETGWDLHTLAVSEASEGPKRLTEDGQYVGHPAWSPDGQKIAYDTLIDGQGEIMVIDLETGVQSRITDRPGNDLVPAWSLDSSSLAYGAETDGNWDVWFVDLETLETQRLTTDEAYDGGVVIVPASVLPDL